MININFNPNLNKNAFSNSNFKKSAPTFSAPKDSVCFTGSKTDSTVILDTEYKNVLKKPLVSAQRATFEKDLKFQKPLCFEASKKRVASLSRYLKEDMIGFVVPKYMLNGEKKGGYQWFEKSAEYLLRGCKQGVQEKDYKPVAKELYGLLAIHDNYWKSPEFVKYLSTLEQNPAIKATIEAIEELGQPKNITFTRKEEVGMSGYFSPLKVIDKIIKDGCAYTGKNFSKYDYKNRPSLEHITPDSWGGPREDYNYLLVSASANYARGNMGLIKYLRGGGAH